MEIKNRVKELRFVKASTIEVNPKNWRVHPKEQQSAMEGILAEIGYAGALLARELPDKKLQLIDGHLRKEITPDQEVPVLIVDLTEQEAEKLLAVFDPISAMAKTDGVILTQVLEDISFHDERLEDLIKELRDEAKRGFLREGIEGKDDLPEMPKEAISKRGDLWILGNHRILCGDSTNANDVERLLANVIPGMCVTDPPYGVEYDPSWRDEAAAKGQIDFAARRTGEVANDEQFDWSAAFSLFRGSVLYCWHAGKFSSQVQFSLEKLGFETRSQIIWSKPHSPISLGHYRWQHESCWYAAKKGKPSNWIGDHSQTTIWPVSLDQNVEGGHSTQKPVELMERAIRNHSFAEIYEPFSGSGTTIIACERSGRSCFAMEIEPLYVDIAVARWEKFTGLKAELEKNI